MTKLYCLKHEKMTYTTEDNDLSHFQTIFMGTEEDVCVFSLGYAYCEPPPSLFEEFDDKTTREWREFCKETEPSPEEIEISDLQAQEFSRDFD